jgi:hypothetical protein
VESIKILSTYSRIELHNLNVKFQNIILPTVLRIRDVTRILDPNFFHPGSEFFHPGSRIRIKEFKYFNSKNYFLAPLKHDPGCSSPIRILILYPSRIRGQKGTGSRIWIRKTACLVYEENDGPVRPVSVDENREGGGAEHCHDCLTTSAKPVLRIRNVYSGSEFFHPGSQIRTRIKEFKYFTPKHCF